MGFLDEIKNKADELGEKAGDAFEAAKDKAGDLIDTGKDKAGDLVEAAKEKLDTDGDGDVDGSDATHAFSELKDRVTGGGDAPADQVAAGSNPSDTGGTEYTIPAEEPAAAPVEAGLAAEGSAVTEDPTDPFAIPADPAASAEAAKDEALADLQAKAEDLKSDNA